jgi:hypothetical protein
MPYALNDRVTCCFIVGKLCCMRQLNISKAGFSATARDLFPLGRGGRGEVDRACVKRFGRDAETIPASSCLWYN